MTGLSVSGIPKGSKLVLIGDWYRKPGKGWYVACYFLGEDHKPFRMGMPVDLLPALTPGAVYPRASTQSEAKGYTGVFKVPAMCEWEKCCYSELPRSLRRLREFSGQIGGQVVYRLKTEERVYWLPAIELARMLFFHSSEVVRAAVYQGNTWQLAKADQKDWMGEVTFSSNVPVSYLNSLQFRKFFAWLLFDVAAENSFCSIFGQLNKDSYLYENVDRWTFDFHPPEMGPFEISWAGYTGTDRSEEQDHCYIREIRAIAGAPAPNLESIIFSHPDDTLFLENESDSGDPVSSTKTRKQKRKVSPKEIDPHNAPKAGKKRYLIRINHAGFHFDSEIDLRRSPRQVRALPKGEVSDLEEIQEEEVLGITEGSDRGSKPRADIDNLAKPELINAPEKIAFFQSMLEQIEAEHGWLIETHTGEVPKKRCRSAHLIDNRLRRYSHATVQRDKTTSIHILEIELTAEESLSTLFFRAANGHQVVDKILDDLMTSNITKKLKAMQWKRKSNAEQTTARLYLDHPDKKIKNEVEALESWVARAAVKIKSL